MFESKQAKKDPQIRRSRRKIMKALLGPTRGEKKTRLDVLERKRFTYLC